MNCVQTLDVAQKNDAFRRSGFGVTITTGIQDLPDIEGLMAEVRDYNRFTEDNDPYHEHDFGSLIWYRQRVFWKIDYYNPELTRFEDPLSDTCNRFITVMLASEY